MEICLAQSDQAIADCFAVMSQLRPHLQPAHFVATVRQMQAEGFQLACGLDQGRVVAVAGFRVSTNLHLGKNLYVDDLVTDPERRSEGYGGQLLAWLEALARQQDCRSLHLDSGCQRQQAHKFYFAQGMTITSFHFVKPL